MRNPSAASAGGQGLGVADDLGGVVAELRLGRLPEGHRLGRDDVLEGTALQAREHRLVDGRGQVGRAQDGAAPRAAQRLVGGEGDDVGHSHRVGVDAAGDEAGDVGGVEEEQGADRVGDRTDRLGVDDPRVGGGAGHDQLRAGAPAASDASWSRSSRSSLSVTP